MSEDILTQIERGRRIGYPDNLIRKSLELEGYSPESIKQAFKEVEQRRNGSGSKVVVKNVRVDSSAIRKSTKESDQKSPEQVQQKTDLLPPMETQQLLPERIDAPSPNRHLLLDVIIGTIMFVIIGILIYLFLVPALLNTM
ncbi:MAG TPA: hypothetical protein VJI75_01295 [Candidatus Nanoarchaeia archaeon]|nr:hypothetical protein [Candidatus Nanoarchaeia archaeon]